jgi:hypothetical protein
MLRHHLNGVCTLASYTITEEDFCRFVVFDCDADDGLFQLFQVQERLAGFAVPSYLEQSRRGGHLWVFLAQVLSPRLVRQALLPSCLPGMEFFPSHEGASFEHPGYAVRLPLGVHRKSGCRYPFVEYSLSGFVPYAQTVREMLLFLSTVERVEVAVLSRLAERNQYGVRDTPTRPSKKSLVSVSSVSSGRWRTIVEWCAEQDPFVLIGRYVDLNHRGEGCCPFGWHHSDGLDAHPSFKVYDPVAPDVMCWYCCAWKQGGSVFDFLKLYHNVTPRQLWHRILSGERF